MCAQEGVDAGEGGEHLHRLAARQSPGDHRRGLRSPSNLQKMMCVKQYAACARKPQKLTHNVARTHIHAQNASFQRLTYFYWAFEG